MPTAQSVHSRLYRSKGAAKSHPCVGCGKTARDWAYQYPGGGQELVDASGQRFSESMEDYAPMCRACHVAFDAEKDPRTEAPAGRRGPVCRPRYTEARG